MPRWPHSQSRELTAKEPSAREMKALLAMSDPKQTVALVTRSRRIAHRFLGELDRRFAISIEGKAALEEIPTPELMEYLDKVARIYSALSTAADKALKHVDGREVLDEAHKLQRQIERDYESLRRLQAQMGQVETIDVTPHGESQEDEEDGRLEPGAEAEDRDRQPAGVAGSGPDSARRRDDWTPWD